MTISDQDWDKFRRALDITTPKAPEVDLVSAVMAKIEKPVHSPLWIFLRWVPLGVASLAVVAVALNFWIARPTISVGDLLREAAPEDARWVMNGTRSAEDILLSSYYGGE